MRGTKKNNNANDATIAAGKIVAAMAQIAPPELALSNDVCGVTLAPKNWETRAISRVILALDADYSAIEAAPQGAMFITHHPRIYQPLKNLDANSPLVNTLSLAIKKELVLFNARTNLDIAPDGVNDRLAALCGLQKTRPAEITCRLPIYKLTVFVPTEFAEKVAAAITAAGAGAIGEYRDCCYFSEGRGQFRPLDSARPFIGKPRKLTSVPETRIEAIVSPLCRKNVELALRTAHPYEEPAFDFTTLDRCENFGLGRIGKLPRPEKFVDFMARMVKATNSRIATYQGNLHRRIETVAVWSGSGAPTIANLDGVDALVGGEIDYHRAEILRQKNIAILALGHYASEAHILPPLKKKLHDFFPLVKISIVENADFLSFINNYTPPR